MIRPIPELQHGRRPAGRDARPRARGACIDTLLRAADTLATPAPCDGAAGPMGVLPASAARASVAVLVVQRWYHPVPRGMEIKIREKLAVLRALDDEHGD